MKRFLAPLGLLCIALGFAIWTWGQWGDAQVDYGGEVYTAWRLSEGAVLYRDVAYFTGPLSPYLNALVLKGTGAGLVGLQVFHALLALLSATLIYRLLRRIGSELCAFAGAAAFLSLFCFARLEFLGNSNYIAPYSHEVAHALPLSLAGLLALARWRERQCTSDLVISALCMGAILLTKLEYMLAYGAAALVALSLARSPARTWLLWMAASLCVPLMAFLALASALPASEALRGVLGAWNYVFDERITELAFYRGVMGTNFPLENARLGALIGAAQLALLAAGYALARFLPWRGPLVATLLAALVAALVQALPLKLPAFLELARAWPLYVGCAALLLVLRAWRERGADPRRMLAACWMVFASLMLLKMILNTRIQMYGFALALPATLGVLWLLIDALPHWAARWRVDVGLARGIGLGLFLGFALGHWRVQAHYLARPTLAVGAAPDTLLVDEERARVLRALLAELDLKLQEGERLLVLPEGVMLNYWLRAPTPARYVNYMPPELLMFGEAEMVQELQRQAPEAIVVLHKPTAEYGFRWFGKDYGRSFAEWINRDYRLGTLHGQEPLRDGTRFGARIAWRKDLAPR